MGLGRVFGILLVLLVGLLNFHVPHFLFQAHDAAGFAGIILELILLANVSGALAAAAGIFRSLRWGWMLGLGIVGFSVVLYLAQETVGLPGLPKAWLEPSRVFSLLVELAYIALTIHQLRHAPALRKGA